jgi:hypothetical protein
VIAKNENTIVDSACKIRLDFNKAGASVESITKQLPLVASSSSAPPKA